MRPLIRILLIIGLPLTFLSTLWLKFVRKAGIGKASDYIFMKLGILPVPDHYYQPLINPGKHLRRSLREERYLPGIDMNTEEQLRLLNSFGYNDELKTISLEKTNEHAFYYNNAFYGPGDAEFLYNIIRHFKPRNIIEIGCGFSTLMIKNAADKNKTENQKYHCRHICIEPYENSWLEESGVEVVRKKAEELDR